MADHVETSESNLAAESSLRRIRSTGDIPTRDRRRPEPLRLLSNTRGNRDPSGAEEHLSPSQHVTTDISTVSVPKNMRQTPHSAGPTVFRPGTPPPAAAGSSDVSSLTFAPGPSTTLASPPPAIVVHHAPSISSPPRETPRTPPAVIPPLRNRPSPPRQHNRSLYSRTMAFFGYGRGASRARRSFVTLIWNLAWGFVQIVLIITFLTISTHRESATMPGIDEWTACVRPLGVWSCLWIIRVFLACGLTYWGFERDRATHADRVDAESEAGVHDSTAAVASPRAAGPRSPRTAGRSGLTPGASPAATDSPETPPLPHTILFRRLSLLSSLFSLSWFLTAHVLEYSSINSCRLSSPHLWWLVFGILCITYLMVLEVIILGLIVFLIAPILFLFWNILLMCLGRHPLQNPTMIKPEIGKLSKSIVESIPLVMYIPPPPDALPTEGPIKIPEAAYSYPPKSPPAVTPAPKRRFRFLRSMRSKRTKDASQEPSDDVTEGKKPVKTGDPQTWEDHWEQEGYPFVVLEGNRAACAICLMDFEEPKRVAGLDAPESTDKEADKEQGTSKGIKEITVEKITRAEEEKQLQLEDAGEGAQPLRLLACGHVFHKTCLDPWLTDVSGRCPVCQRPVDIPVPEKKKKNRRQNPQQ